MILMAELQKMAQDIAMIKQAIVAVPEWIPLSEEMAQSYGRSLTALRTYCKSHIEPTKFRKFGKLYHIHKSALSQISVKKQVVNI